MTKVKLDSKIGGSAAAAIEQHVPTLYARLGMRILGIVEFSATERVQPAPDSENEPSVKMRISCMELATREQEDTIRDAMRALYLQRTAMGTLQEDGQVELTEDTIKLTAGLLTDIEVARLRVGAANWAFAARKVANSGKDLSASELRHEMRTIADGLTQLLDRAAATD